MPTSNLSISYHFVTTPSSIVMDWFSWLSKTTLDPSLIYDYGLTFARNELQLEDATYFNHEFLQSMGISIAKHRLEILKLVKKEEAKTPNKKFSGVIKKCLRKCMSKFTFREDHDNNNIKGLKDIKDMPLPPLLQPQLQEPNWYNQGKWKGTQVIKKQQQHHGTEEVKDEKLPRVPMYRSRTIALSGPLDHSRMHEKMVNTKALRLSGPLDGKMNERMMMYTNRSPLISRHMDGGRFNATTAKSPRVSSGPLNPARVVTRASDVTRAEVENPMGSYSPYKKPKANDLDYDVDDDDDDHTLWPTLFQDLKPT
ncbi:hypothetical protein RIF29_07620 [Crotalaria pallida]|uniref:SAM domain-containing protein n=1 Tax=Crotalaria pallida TaxID=3830 RepID=A0AAN9PAX0_CROPI